MNELLKTYRGRALATGASALAAGSLAAELQPVADLLAVAGVEHPQRAAAVVWIVGGLIDAIVTALRKRRTRRKALKSRGE